MRADPTAGRVYQAAAGILVERFEDGGLVLRVADERIVHLNPVALFVLDHTDGARTVAQVAEAVGARFGIPAVVVHDDVEEAYRGMHEMRLVDLSDRGGVAAAHGGRAHD